MYICMYTYILCMEGFCGKFVAAVVVVAVRCSVSALAGRDDVHYLIGVVSQNFHRFLDRVQ
jgi:hypothetical protein